MNNINEIIALRDAEVFYAMAEAMDYGHGPEVLQWYSNTTQEWCDFESWDDVIGLWKTGVTIRYKPSTSYLTDARGQQWNFQSPLIVPPNLFSTYYVLFGDEQGTRWENASWDHCRLKNRIAFATKDAKDDAERAVTGAMKAATGTV